MNQNVDNTLQASSPCSSDEWTLTSKETPDISAASPISQQTLALWRGSISLFDGITNTRPAEEKKDRPFQEIVNTVCPEQQLVTTDKELGGYFIPCLLKDAPLVGNTLKNAEQNGQPTVC